MRKQGWKLFKNVWISEKPVLPGIWQRKEGGHLVRARVLETTTGMLRKIPKNLPEASAADALKWLEDEKARIRAGLDSAPNPRMRFSEFAASLFESKVNVGEIKERKGT